MFSYVKTRALLKTLTSFLLANKKLVGFIMQTTRETEVFTLFLPSDTPKLRRAAPREPVLCSNAYPGPFWWGWSHF